MSCRFLWICLDRAMCSISVLGANLCCTALQSTVIGVQIPFMSRCSVSQIRKYRQKAGQRGRNWAKNNVLHIMWSTINDLIIIDTPYQIEDLMLSTIFFVIFILI